MHYYSAGLSTTDAKKPEAVLLCQLSLAIRSIKYFVWLYFTVFVGLLARTLCFVISVVALELLELITVNLQGKLYTPPIV